jgi:DNA-binding transcriptional MerR regulator
VAQIAERNREAEDEEVRREKSPDAFRTISEVADGLNVPQHVLRFWETRFSQIRPMKRGGGRRYYRPNDIDLLKGIRQLLYGQGYTIRGVQRILKESGTAHVVAIGRGEIKPGTPNVLENEPKSVAIAPRRPSRAALRQVEPDDPAQVTEAPASPSVLNVRQLGLLREALGELSAARKLLSSDG